jgi:hypothetical protein
MPLADFTKDGSLFLSDIEPEVVNVVSASCNFWPRESGAFFGHPTLCAHFSIAPLRVHVRSANPEFGPGIKERIAFPRP